ncbi:MAG: hypothetical protein V4561_14205 [Bacteroidota bacterium]
MLWEKLFNPFLRIAGFRSLWIGLVVLILVSGLAVFCHCHFDGALDVHIGAKSPTWFYFAENFIAWISLFVTLYVAGRFSSKSKIRVVDVAGTVVLARWPMIFVVLAAFIIKDTPITAHDITAPLIVFGFISMVFSISMIALLYNAYSVSCNVKGSRATLSFIIAIIVAETISKLIIINLQKII